MCCRDFEAGQEDLGEPLGRRTGCGQGQWVPGECWEAGSGEKPNIRICWGEGAGFLQLSAQIPHLHPQKVREWLGGVMESLEEEAPGSVTTHSGGLSCLVKGGSSQGQQRHGGLRAEDSQ